MIFNARAGGEGEVPDLTLTKDYAGRYCTAQTSDRFVCTRPAHSRLTLHAAGTGNGVARFWADGEGINRALGVL